MDDALRQMILSGVRQALMALGSGLVTSGTISSDGLQQIAGGVTAAIGLIWTLWASRNKANALKDAKS